MRTNDGDNGWAPTNEIVAEVGSRVGTRIQLIQCRRDMPISSRQGGDADGHDEEAQAIVKAIAIVVAITITMIAIAVAVASHTRHHRCPPAVAVTLLPSSFCLFLHFYS